MDKQIVNDTLQHIQRLIELLCNELDINKDSDELLKIGMAKLREGIFLIRNNIKEA